MKPLSSPLAGLPNVGVEGEYLPFSYYEHIAFQGVEAPKVGAHCTIPWPNWDSYILYIYHIYNRIVMHGNSNIKIPVIVLIFSET